MNTMKHREYLYTAKRHLAACQMFFKNTEWEITPKKSDLLKEKAIQLISKEDYIAKKYALLKKWISLLQKQTASIDKHREWLQETNAFYQEKMEPLANISNQLQNSTMWLIQQNDLLNESDNSTYQLAPLLETINEQLKESFIRHREQKLQIKENDIFLEQLSSKLKDSVHQLESIANEIDQEFPQRIHSDSLKREELQENENAHLLEEFSIKLNNQEHQTKALSNKLKSYDSNLNAISQELNDDINKLEEIDAFTKDVDKTINEQKTYLEENIDKLKKQLGETEYITYLDKQESQLRKNKIFLKQHKSYTKKDVYQSKEYKILLRDRKDLSNLEAELDKNDVLLKKKFKHFNDELEKKKYLLKDIYYLTGYILEALTIYAAYEGGRFKGERITDLDIEFTENTHIDYYKVNWNNNKKCWRSNRQYPQRDDEKYSNEKGIEQYEKDSKALIELNKLIDEWKQKEFEEWKQKNFEGKWNRTCFHCVEDHHFYEIITNVLNNRNIENTLITNDVPYLSSTEDIPIENAAIKNKVITLIQNWDTSLRYTEKESEKWTCIEKENALQQETLEQLIKLCETIFAAINHA